MCLTNELDSQSYRVVPVKQNKLKENGLVK